MTVAELKEKLSHVDDYLDVKVEVPSGIEGDSELVYVKSAQIESSPTTRRVFVITPEVP